MLRRLWRRRVIANLKSGTVFRGILWSGWGRLIVLRQAELLQGDRHVPTDGEVVVDRRDVDFLQVEPKGD